VSGEQVPGEPGDVLGEPWIGALMGSLGACQLEDECERFLGEAGRPGEPPGASLGHEVIHGDGGVPVFAADGEGDLTVVGLVCLRHEVVGGTERDRPVGRMEQGEVLRVHVEVAHGGGEHHEFEKPLQRIAVPDGGEHTGDALEADFAAVLLVLLVTRRTEDLVEVFLVDAPLRSIGRTVVALDHQGRHARELLDPGREGGEPGGPGEACPEFLVIDGRRVVPRLWLEDVGGRPAVDHPVPSFSGSGEHDLVLDTR
jgi:hypothetical protein